MNTYFDNGATSHPKSEAVISAVEQYLRHGGSYGRSAYQLSVDNTRMVERCRTLMARLIGAKDSDSIVFGANATWGANSILQCLDFNKGDIIYHSALEHNAVMRPLLYLKKTHAIELRILPSKPNGKVDIEQLKTLDFQGVKLVIVNHASNVNGLVQPLEEISKCIPSNVKFMVDTAQSLGCIDVNVEQMKIDYLIFTGHKSLGGVTGSGGFFTRHPLPSFIYGGTGSRSDSYEMPEEMPDKYEAGTPNLVGIAALYAALKEEKIQQHTRQDYKDFITKLKNLDGINLYASEEDVELFSFTHNRLTPSEIADSLSVNYNIAVRQGLHCAPLAHQTLGTFPEGTVRVSLSKFHSNNELDYFVTSIKEIINKK